MSTEIIDGVIIGGVGGAIAGLTVWGVTYGLEQILKCIEKKRVYKWLQENSEDIPGQRYRSTRVIASHNNLTLDRTRYICSIHKGIYLSTGQTEEMWGLYGRSHRE